MRLCCSERSCCRKGGCCQRGERRAVVRMESERCNVFCSVEKSVEKSFVSLKICQNHRYYIVSHVSWQLCQWLLKSITKVLRDPMVSPKHKVSPSLLRGIVSKLIHLCPNQINNKIVLTKEDDMIYIFE